MSCVGQSPGSAVYDRTLFTKIPGLDHYYISLSARCIRFNKSVNELSKSIENNIRCYWILTEPEHLKFNPIPVEELMARTYLSDYYPGCKVHFIDGNNYHYRIHNMRCV